jgi:uncharacterized membrane protein YgcG
MRGGKQKKVEVAASTTPFAKHIAEYQPTEVVPTPIGLGTYDGTTDPEDFITEYNQAKVSNLWSDNTACVLFPGQLRGVAHGWFYQQAPGSIKSYADLRTKFLTKYATQRRQVLTFIDINTIKQKPRELLPAFIDRFRSICAQVPNLEEHHTVSCFICGIDPDRFLPLVQRLRRHLPDTFDEAVQEVRVYIRELGAIIPTNGQGKGRDNDGGNSGNGGGSQGGQGNGGGSGKGNGSNGGGRGGKFQNNRGGNRGKPYEKPVHRHFTASEDATYRSLLKTPSDIL